MFEVVSVAFRCRTFISFHSTPSQNHFIFCKQVNFTHKAQTLFQNNFTNMVPTTDPSRKASRNSLTQHGLSLRLGMSRLSSPVGQSRTEPYGDDAPSFPDWSDSPRGRGCSGELLELMSDGKVSRGLVFNYAAT